MPGPLPLDTLTALARERNDEAARRLGELLRAQAGAAEQLALLLQYRQEYLDQRQQGLREGMSAAQLRNFQHFMATLDGAIEQQHRLAQQADSRLDSGRSEWRDSRRRLGSFDTLAQRSRLEAALMAARREQREGDERAAQRFLRSSVFAG